MTSERARPESDVRSRNALAAGTEQGSDIEPSNETLLRIRELHPSFYPLKDFRAPFLVAPPNKTPLYSEVSKTTNICYNKYNHTAWLVYRTLIGLPSKGCLHFMSS